MYFLELHLQNHRYLNIRMHSKVDRRMKLWSLAFLLCHSFPQRYLQGKMIGFIKNLFLIVVAISISACGDSSVIYKNTAELEEPYNIKLNVVRIDSETKDSLTVEFIYTYNHEIPPEEVKLFVLPDHGYWQTADVKVSKGKHGARTIIGLSKRNMEKDEVSESESTKLRFRFDHYLPDKYMGNIWGQDIEYRKHWERTS